MKIRVPYFAQEWRDEGILTFAAFALRVCERYGYDEWYTLHAEDLSVMCNKRRSGIVPWLRQVGVGDIQLGEPFEHTLMFKLPQPTKVRSDRRISYVDIKSERQQQIWMYTMGCLNHNLMTDKPVTTNTYRPNSYHITEFKITREAIDYIKIADRH